MLTIPDAGIGPVEAIKGALKRANLTIDDIDVRSTLSSWQGAVVLTRADSFST
jgi:flavin-binding protein dodecin